MKQERSVLLIVSAYLLWIALAAGIVLILLLGRTALLSSLAAYSSKGFYQSVRTGLIEKGYFMFGGLAALSFIIVLELSLSRSPSWTTLLQKALFAFGVESFLVFAATVVTQLAAEIFFRSPTLSVSVIAPACMAILFFFASAAMRKKQHPS